MSEDCRENVFFSFPFFSCPRNAAWRVIGCKLETAGTDELTEIELMWGMDGRRTGSVIWMERKSNTAIYRKYNTRYVHLIESGLNSSCNDKEWPFFNLAERNERRKTQNVPFLEWSVLWNTCAPIVGIWQKRRDGCCACISRYIDSFSLRKPQAK